MGTAHCIGQGKVASLLRRSAPLFSGRVWPKANGAGVAGPTISGQLRYFSEGTVRQGRPDSEHPDPADQTFFFGSTNLPRLSGSTPRSAGYLRPVKPERRQFFLPPNS